MRRRGHASASRGLRLRKAALVSIAGLVCLTSWCVPACTQESTSLGGVQSFAFSTTYSPSSSHILIGDAEQRRVWTLGAQYTHRLRQTPQFRLDYEGSIMPVYEETDPAVVGTIFSFSGQSFFTPLAPTRLIYAVRGPVGSVIQKNGSVTPITAVLTRQNTYAAALSPLGVRISAFPRSRIQPGFALDLGFVVSARDIPVDQTAQFNYMFSFGPGFEVFASPRTSWRFEYIYRHTSNAGQGVLNPGVDQGVVRITLSHSR